MAKGKDSGKTVKTDELKTEAVGGAKPEDTRVVTRSLVEEALHRALKKRPSLKNATNTAVATATKKELERMGYKVNIAQNTIKDGNVNFTIREGNNGSWGVIQSEKRK